MDNRNAYLISCSDHYSHRLNVIDAYLRSRGYHVTYITSDFDHMSKKIFECKVPGCIQLHAKPYFKNLSMDRILSHRGFARKVFQYLERLPHQPDVILALLPPNFLAHYTAKYKRRHPRVRLIFDIFDLWPEAFPSSKVKKALAPVFRAWAWIRDHNLSSADCIITECDLFRRYLGLTDSNSASVYLCADSLSCGICPADLREDRLDLCYLGSINNIIGIADICDFLRQLLKYKPVTLHIIGEGERQQEFIDSARAAGAQVEFYSAVYDDKKKQEIMCKCHFGLNIVKSSVCLGLTMKSVEYFRHGLPIISNVTADTQTLVQEKKIGIQLDAFCAERIANMTVPDYLQMRSNVQRVFDAYFKRSVIDEQYAKLLSKIL